MRACIALERMKGRKVTCVTWDGPLEKGYMSFREGPDGHGTKFFGYDKNRRLANKVSLRQMHHCIAGSMLLAELLGERAKFKDCRDSGYHPVNYSVTNYGYLWQNGWGYSK